MATKKKVIVIAPHPDDETLGCGGTLLRHRLAGCELHWLIVTGISEKEGFPASLVKTRAKEIQTVAKRYGFAKVHDLAYPTTKLDMVPMSELIGRIAAIFKEVGPEIVYVPFHGDAHSDHAVAFDAVAACTKWFRYPTIARVLAYEAISETDASLGVETFRPNTFVNIASQLEDKLKIMALYSTEGGKFPFPRSAEAIRAAAHVRGAASGFKAAEAFVLLRDRQS